MSSEDQAKVERFDKRLEKRGIELTEDNSLPLGSRTQRNVKRIIAAVRAAEGEFNDLLRETQDACIEAQKNASVLQAENTHLRDVVRKMKMAEALKSVKVLDEDKIKLLSVA